MSLKRLPDWRTRLFSLIDEKDKQPFQYGLNDCSTFGADVVFALTGFDPAAQFRGKYKTKLGGIRAIRKAGYLNQVDYLEKNYKEIPPAFATFGDIGITTSDAGDDIAICVVVGNFSVGVSADGISKVSNSDLIKVFKIC